MRKQYGWGVRGWGASQNNAWKELLKISTWAIRPDMPDGQPFTKLEPRTLPNGVSNTDYTQNVSVDVVITRAMVGSINVRTNFAQAVIAIGSFSPPPLAFQNAIQGTFLIPNWTEKASSQAGSYVPNLFETRVDGLLSFDVPLGTTLEQARDILAGTVIRYQLATPIDTLNTAKVNPLVDRAGVVGKNLFDPASAKDGYIDILTGALVPDNNLYHSDFISCVQGEVFIHNRRDPNFRGTSITFFNLNKVFLSSLANETVFTAPTGASFFKINCLKADTPATNFQVEKGSVRTTFEPYSKANVLMTNVAWTNLDGYKVETINGKTNVFFNLDGVDTFGALNSASAPNPTGSDDFWQLVVFRPDDLTGRYFGISRNADSGSTLQYALLVNASGTSSYAVGDALSPFAGNITNLSYAIYGRVNNNRFINLNGQELASATFVGSITTRPNTQLGCRSNSADGLTKSAFSKGLQGICAMQVAPQGTIDKAKVVATVAKAMKQIYGLGV